MSQVAEIDHALGLVLDDQAFLLPMSGSKARAVSRVVSIFGPVPLGGVSVPLRFVSIDSVSKPIEHLPLVTLVVKQIVELCV